MAGLKLQGFAGFVPRQSPYLLADGEAQKAVNTKLYSNEIRSWQKPGALSERRYFDQFVPAMIYRSVGSSGDDVWLGWEDDVDLVPGPIYDSGSPLYYTGDTTGDGGKPKKTNATLAGDAINGGPDDYLLMGVPAPTVAPSVTASGGSGTAETRVYLFTYISLFGTIEEESAPSLVSGYVTVLPGGTVTITGLPPAAPSGKYNITKLRIYRSVTGSSSTTFLKVKDVPIGTTSTTDNLSATALGGSIPSITWSEPPDGLRGLVGMANGIMAGFVDNQVYFCEPFTPHAWPAEYALSVEYPIVGLAAVGSSLVVATRGNPFIITGSNPASMTQEKLPLYEPCVSKRSIASDVAGAKYASPNGIINISTAGADNVTRSLFTRDEWDLYTPSSMLGEIQDGRYFLFYEAWDGEKGGLILDRNSQNSPLTKTNLWASAAHTDPVNAKLYIAHENEVKGWDTDPYNGLPYEWKSKVFVFPRPLNLGAGQIDADFENSNPIGKQGQLSLIDHIKQVNQQIWASVSGLLGNINDKPLNEPLLNGSVLNPIPLIDERFITLTIFADGKQRAVIHVRNHQPFRLPSGFKADRWEFQVNGNVPLRFIKVAETSKELAQI